MYQYLWMLLLVWTTACSSYFPGREPASNMRRADNVGGGGTEPTPTASMDPTQADPGAEPTNVDDETAPEPGLSPTPSVQAEKSPIPGGSVTTVPQQGPEKSDEPKKEPSPKVSPVGISSPTSTEKPVLNPNTVVVPAPTPVPSAPAQPKPASGKFVTVNPDTQQFMLDGKEFRFAGANAGWLLQKQAERPENYQGIDRAFQVAKKLGMRVIRTWAFSDDYMLQKPMGQFNEVGFKALDKVIAKANKYDLKLILTFVDFMEYPDIGGMSTYVRWAGLGSQNRYAFYTHSDTKAGYKAYMLKLLTRVNTYNKIEYRQDPTIMAWELANEARMGSFGVNSGYATSGADDTGAKLKAWYQEMAKYFKSLNQNQLLTTGEEGFETLEHLKQLKISKYALNAGSRYPFENGEGSSFTENISIPEIDFASIHVYHSYFLPDTDKDVRKYIENAKHWIWDHNKVAKAAKKPLLVGEFGWADPADHLAVVRDILKFNDEQKIPGSLIWGFRLNELTEVDEKVGFPVPEDFSQYAPALEFRKAAFKIMGETPPATTPGTPSTSNTQVTAPTQIAHGECELIAKVDFPWYISGDNFGTSLNLSLKNHTSVTFSQGWVLSIKNTHYESIGASPPWNWKPTLDAGELKGPTASQAWLEVAPKGTVSGFGAVITGKKEKTEDYLPTEVKVTVNGKTYTCSVTKQ